MGDQFEVSSGGKVVGPVSLDQMRRGLATGMIPKDAQARPLGTTTWQSVADLLAQGVPQPPAPASPTTAAPPSKGDALQAWLDRPQGGREDPPAGSADPSAPDLRSRDERLTGTRYVNLLAVSRSLGIYGGTLKLLGILLGCAALIAAAFVGGAYGMIAGGAGVLFAVAVHWMGTCIAAMGEGLLALADIAVNTARIP